MSSSFERYDRIATLYPAMWPLIVPGYLPILSGMLEVVHAMARQPRQILDLGCGPASASVAVAPACDPTTRVVLVDGSSRMLSEAQRILGARVAKAILGDFRDAAVTAEIAAAGPYDLVLASFALHHVDYDAKRRVIDTLAPTLAPGGLVLLADEIAAERPAGWDLVERVRSRIIRSHLETGHISEEFWRLESTLPEAAQLPFIPARTDELQSWLARAGLAASAPIVIFGSALMVALKTG